MQDHRGKALLVETYKMDYKACILCFVTDTRLNWDDSYHILKDSDKLPLEVTM